VSIEAGTSTGLAGRLREILGAAAVLEGESVRSRSAGIWGPPRTVAANLLVRPRDTEGLSRVLALCHELRQTVVVHGGLTGVVDGAWAESSDLVLSLESLSGVEAVDPLAGTLRVRAGTTLQAVQDAATEHGLMFPLDLGARGTATIGGNAATNAGGNRVIRYGMMRALIVGLEAVLADGTVLSSLSPMVKNNAGYDLKQLFIGSEGTLGVITRLTLQLVPAAHSRQTALVAVGDFAGVCRLLASVRGALGGQLSAFEVMWPEFYAFINAGLNRANPGRIPPLEPGGNFYVLVEALGSDVEQDGVRFENAFAEAATNGAIAAGVIAKSGAEEEALWLIRDDVVQLLEMEPSFLFDVSLPLGETEAYVTRVRDALSDAWPDHRLLVFGHLGDGNIHLGISAGPADGSARARIEEIVYQPLGAVGGSVSAEHGIGLEKKPYLTWCRSADEIRLMRALKKTLDPRGILNPGKVFD
jgi:FAD/FMN-containing dehydrogenase